MKNFLLGMLVVIIIGGIGLIAYQYGKTAGTNLSATPTLTQEPTPTTEFAPLPTTDTSGTAPTIATQSDADLIKAALAKKNNWPADNDITVTVSTNDGTYASGTAGGQGGGGFFFAKKVNGEWVIVADGNGVILCSSLTNYPDYPSSLIPECYDEVTQKNVAR